jgi:hypothetical protein
LAINFKKMNKISTLITTLSIAMVLLLAASCTGKKKSHEVEAADHTLPTTPMASFIDRYFKIKFGLTTEDSASVVLHAKAMSKPLTMDKSVMYKDAAVAAQQVDTLRQLAAQLAGATGNKAKRKLFVKMTEPMQILLRNINDTTTYYVQNCTMAPDYAENSNARWLSKTEKVFNPLYPKSMPNCGTVVDTLKNK